MAARPQLSGNRPLSEDGRLVLGRACEGSAGVLDLADRYVGRFFGATDLLATVDDRNPA